MQPFPGTPARAARGSSECSWGGARRRFALGLAAGACALSPLAAAQGQPEVVGRVEIALPAPEVYVLRATMPVPPGTWNGQGLVPLQVRNLNGSLAPTQMEIVTRYPRADQGAAVVELIARVRRPSNLDPGDRVRYDVVRSPHAEGAFQVENDVRALLETPGSLVLSTRDVYGNEYRADLLRDLRQQNQHLRVLRDGELARQHATHEVLLPGQPQAHGVYPHMMGVHAYVGEWAGERLVTLDLHVHNGMAGLDKTKTDDDAMQKLYFESIDLHVPDGWFVFSDFASPTLGQQEDTPTGSKISLVAPMRDGSMHVLPRQGHLVRRLVLARGGGFQAGQTMLAERALAFCVAGRAPSGRELWSWWNRLTARYYPQCHRLPDLSYLDIDDIRGDLAARFSHYANSIAAGVPPGYPVTSPALGYAQPWGIKYGGQTGGDEIVLYDGVEVAASASQEGYRLSQLAMRLYVDRQRTALYNRDGGPTRDVDWLVDPPNGDPYIPMIFYGVPNIEDSDPFGFLQAPTFHDAEVAQQGRVPGYEAELLLYQPIDLQHYIRFTRNLKTLAWLGNDALAKQELAMASECMRLSYHEHFNNPNGYIQGSGLRAAIGYVASFPGWGFGFGRGNGWGLDAAVAAYALGDDERRARFYPWFEKIVDLVEDGQSTCTGILQAQPSSKVADGQYRVVQSFEEAITGNMLYGMRSTVFAGRDVARAQTLADVITRSVYGLCGPTAWRPEYGGSVDWVALGANDMSQPPFCGAPLRDDAQSNGADHALCWSGFAYAYELTGDGLFLRRAQEAAGGTHLLDFMHSSNLFNIGSRVALYALTQDLYE